MNYLLLLLLLSITFIRRIYNCIPGTSHVLWYKNDTDVLWLIYLAHVIRIILRAKRFAVLLFSY